jgi:hypothetical protein
MTPKLRKKLEKLKPQKHKNTKKLPSLMGREITHAVPPKFPDSSQRQALLVI